MEPLEREFQRSTVSISSGAEPDLFPLAHPIHGELKSFLIDLLAAVLAHRPRDIRAFLSAYVRRKESSIQSRAWLSTVDHMSGPRPLVVCGPSGSGKGTLLQRIRAAFPVAFAVSVSHTTRKPRPGEVDGQHYHFVTRENMIKLIEQGAFLEHAHVHANIYGTSLKSVQSVANENKICLLEIDVQGAQQASKHPNFNPHFLFISPPSLEILEQRLRGRQTESDEQIAIRMAAAKKEMEFADSSNLFEKFIINNDLAEAVEEMKNVMREWYPKLCIQ